MEKEGDILQSPDRLPEDLGAMVQDTEGSADMEPFTTGVPWPGPFLECLLQASVQLNLTAELKDQLQSFASLNYSQLTDDELYFHLLNDTAFMRETNGTPLWNSVTDCLGPASQDRPYLLPWWQQLVWTLAFGSMLVVAVGGNAIVMWIVIEWLIICLLFPCCMWLIPVAHRRMRTVTNYFLVNLSAADLLMSVLNCIFNFIYMLHSDWPFGSVYCTISNFMANVTIAASVFTLMAISFDRYIAIVRPLKPRMTKSEARNFIIFIWASSMLLALPCLLYSTTVSIRYKNNEIRRGCFLLWPDGKTSISYREYVYNIVFFATTYLLPMLVMLISYSLVSCELWGSHSIGELTDRQANSIKSKRRVVRMFIVIVVVFMLCWLPQQAFFLYQYHNNQVLDTANIQHIYLGFYWLAMANAMVNPIIYYWMNARFRSYFREVVLQCRPGRCCCCCCSRSNSYLDSPHLTRRRCDSADHTSRSRSDVNGAPRCIVSAVPRHNNHLLVYSSRGKVNNRAGGLSPHSCSQTGLLQTDNLRMKEFSYKPIEDKNHARKPLRAEEDWHYIQYLSDQKALRVRNEQTFSRPVHRTNGYQKSQQESLLAKKKEVQNNLTEETKFVTFGADKRAEPIHKEDSSSKSLPSDNRGSDLSKELTPRINVITTSQSCSGDSQCSASVSKKESPKELRDSSKESKPVRGNCDQPSTLSSEKLDTCSTLEGSRSSIATVSDNCESSTLKSQCSRSNERVDALSDHFLFSSYRDSYRKMKYLNGNLVHQAIEETLVAVKKQALTREMGSVSTTNVVCKSPSGQSLGGTKELML